jgi:hypothetical protein
MVERAHSPTVHEVVKEAALLCDPDGEDVQITALILAVENDERPAEGLVPRLADDLDEVVAAAGNGEPTPAASMTARCAAWLATNLEFAHDRERVLRESARAGFDGKPPRDVADWLTAQDVRI